MSEFRNGLFDCFGSMPDCLLGYCCPCILAAMASNSAGQDTVWAAVQCLCYPLLIPILRNQVRKDRNIEGSLVGDLAAGWCCPCCATIQVKREVE